ncbi:MAG: lysophospholipid acyltransferase family protein [Candidatus Aminicenantes bacterium]
MRTIVLCFVLGIIAILLIPVILLCFLIRWPLPIIMIGKGAIHLGQKILGIRLKVSGLERIDKKTSYVFMSNHLSAVDGPLLFILIPQSIRVILKKEAFRIPVIGQAMRLVGFIPVDRKGLRGGKQSIDRATRTIKEKGYSFLIFPEGTRSRDGKLQLFKRGGFFLALNSQVPVAPVSIQGTFELMPKKSFFIKKGNVEIAFHPAVPVQEYNRDTLPRLMDRVRDAIKSSLDD